MREDVCIIVANKPREKRELAEELIQRLRARRLSVERLEPNKLLTKILKQRNPRVVISDYIIGNICTALDLLSDLHENRHCDFVLWTDEPSVYAAVSALKLGAKDFIEMGTPTSVERVVKTVETCLREQNDKAPSLEQQSTLSNELPVGLSLRYKQCLNLVAAAGRERIPLLVLAGPCGAGRNTLALHFHQHREQAGCFYPIDYDLWPQPLNTLLGNKHERSHLPLLSQAATVLLDHAQCDTGELLEAVAEASPRLWPPKDRGASLSSALVIGTTSTTHAREWQRLVGAKIIEIPALGERPEDFLPLIQHFLGESGRAQLSARIRFSVPVIQEITKWVWPGNVRELRAVVHELATLGNVPNDAQEATSVSKSLTKDERQTLEGLAEACKRWERYSIGELNIPAPLAARRAYDEAQGNLRIAAVRLGTTIPSLRKLIFGPAFSALSNSEGKPR